MDGIAMMGGEDVKNFKQRCSYTRIRVHRIRHWLCGGGAQSADVAQLVSTLQNIESARRVCTYRPKCEASKQGREAIPNPLFYARLHVAHQDILHNAPWDIDFRAGLYGLFAESHARAMVVVRREEVGEIAHQNL